MALRQAQTGDIVIALRCRCPGAVLVAAGRAADWRCEHCHQAGQPAGRYQLTGAGIDPIGAT